jgi:hypothetical protein
MQIFILNSDPDTPPLTVRPSKKRKALDDEAAFPGRRAFVCGGCGSRGVSRASLIT